MTPMRKKRRTHSPEFKARIALEALKEIKTVNQIAAENEIHPVQVSTWKKELKEQVSPIYERKNGKDKGREVDEKSIEALERKVGQLTMERDWLSKKSGSSEESVGSFRSESQGWSPAKGKAVDS